MRGLSISDVVERTGVAEGTLRMWERRHGFPVPERLPSGHRRYSEEQVERVLRVVAGRAAGLSLTAAIERAQRETNTPATSLFAAIRRRRPDLAPRTIPKHILIALSHAVEDESLSRAERPLLFASFQRERFYDRERGRFRELSRGAELAVVFADFKRVRERAGAPAEIPVDRTHPLTREWAIVCDAEHHAVCLAGWERPGAQGLRAHGCSRRSGASNRRSSERPRASAPRSPVRSARLSSRRSATGLIPSRRRPRRISSGWLHRSRIGHSPI